MTFFDLSHPITTGMPVYPGDPEVSITPALTVETDGTNVARLALGTHTGTHLDAPLHSVIGGRSVDHIDLELLYGIAYVLPVRLTDRESLASRAVGITDFDTIPQQLPKIVCIATGWDQYFHEPLRDQHPFLDLQLAETLWSRGARVLGVDTLSPDPTSQHTHEFPIHDFWLGQDGVIVENLRGLTRLPHQVQMNILPLNLTGLDGSPVRAIAQPL